MSSLIDHINTFQPPLKSCWLEPVIKYDELTSDFTMDATVAINHNLKLIEMLMELKEKYNYFTYTRQKFIDLFEKKLFIMRTGPMD